MIVWHPKVHEHFQECLLFYLLRIHPYDRENFQKLIRKHLEEREISAYCIYEVYGAHDIIIRLWLPEDLTARFDIELLEKTQLNIRQILTFRVSDQPYYWCWNDTNSPAPMEVDLNTVIPDHVRAIRAGSDPKLKRELCKKNLIREIRPEESIKCFVAISYPETSTDAATERILDGVHRVLQEGFRKREIFRLSIYLGLGFSWAIVKMETRQFYDISQTTTKLWKELYAFGSHTHTHIVAGRNYVQNDDISEAAIRAVGGKDLVVNSFLPELYKQEVERSKSRRIEDLVRSKIIPIKLEPGERERIHDCLVAVIDNNQYRFVSALITTFGECEKYLRDNTHHFLNKVLQKRAISEIFRKVGIDKDKKRKLLALGDFLNIFAATIKKANIAKEEELHRGWQEAAKVRNSCVHGEINLDRDWESAIVVFSEFLSRYRKLHEIVSNVVAKRNVSRIAKKEKKLN